MVKKLNFAGESKIGGIRLEIVGACLLMPQITTCFQQEKTDHCTLGVAKNLVAGQNELLLVAWRSSLI